MILSVSLVFDRTADDVRKLRNLKKGSVNSWTSTDWQLWNSGKGAYNYQDLNRVGTAVTEIAASLGVSISAKTDWTVTDTPTKAQMTTYLNNIKTLAQRSNVSTKGLPATMDSLTYTGANAIEKILYNISQKT